MSELSLDQIMGEATPPEPLLIDINALAAPLSRSVPFLPRDDAAGRIPAGIGIGGAKRWRTKEIARWVDAECPDGEVCNATTEGR
jgi:hypothetical protein